MMKNHPIQLLNVFVEEFSVKVHDRIKYQSIDYPQTFDYAVGRTEFDESTKIIGVCVNLSIKPKDEAVIDRPFSLFVSVSAQFSVDTDTFPIDKIDHWATHNAPIVILPYIREHAYSLTMRAGFDPIILPLVEVPTVKIVKAD